MMAIESETKLDTAIWIADSGCSIHMTPNQNWINDYKPFEQEKHIVLGDNHQIPAMGSGWIHTEFGQLRDVHYVPGLSANLFSIASATNRGVEARCTKEGIKLEKDGQEILAGKREHGIFTLKFQVSGGEDKAYSAIPLSEWHEKFGHVSTDVIKRMAEKKLVEGLQIKDDGKPNQCTDCVLGKCKRASHPGRSTPRATQPGQSLHLDTVGPFKQESLGGSKYLVLCKDETSSYRIGKVVATKSDIPNQVKQIISESELKTGNKVLRINTDNGTEFCNNSVMEFLEDKGITFQTSVPYTPQQNGLIERDIRTVVEAARTMLIRSGLPARLWAEAVNTAIYVLNRTINSRDLTKTPYEKWCGVKPNVNNLHKFGQHAIVIYRDNERTKWDSKGEKQIFVGYTDVHNTYRFYDPETERVDISCDAVFLEDVKKERQRDAAPIQEDEEEFNISDLITDMEQEGDVTRDIDLSWDYEGMGVNRHSIGDEDTSAEHHLPGTSRNTHTPNRHDTERPSLIPVKEGSRRDSLIPRPGNVSRELKLFKKERISKEMIPEGQQKRRYVKLDHIKDVKEKLKPSDIHPRHVLPHRLRSEVNKHRANVATFEAAEDPHSYEEAMKREDKKEWIKAMQEEIDSLKKNEVYDLIDRPQGNIVTNKWVLKIKRKPNGEIERYKARLVARGFSQVHGIDYSETYAPVANMISIRMLFAYAAMTQLKMAQFDVKTAFLYGDLDETVYMEQPEGFEEPGNKVCLLKKSLYGLKQSPRQWNMKFTKFLTDMNLTMSQQDNCVFYKLDPLVIIAIYVDDGLIFAERETDIEEIIERLKQTFEIHTLEVSSFLGFQISRAKSGEIALHQTTYIKNVLKRFAMDRCNPVESPLSISKVKNEDKTKCDQPYREAIGCLMYAAVITRVDIAHAVALASRNVENPTNQNWMDVKRIFRYLKDKEHFALVYKPGGNSDLVVYCDADFAGDKTTARSTTGSLFLYGGAPVYWRSQRQSLVTLSSTEAEFVSLCTTAKDTIYIRKFAKELKLIDDKPTMIYCDNQSAIKIAANDKCVHRTRHMSVQAHYPKEQIEIGEINVKHIRTDNQLADMLTKATTTGKYCTNVAKVMVKTLLLLTVILGIIYTTSAFQFEKVDQIIWLPMDKHKVETDTLIYNLDLTYANPCEKIPYYKPKTAIDYLTKDDNSVYLEIEKKCNDTYNLHWTSRLDELCAMSLDNKELTSKARGLRRHKRVPFILILGGFYFSSIVITNLIQSYVGEIVPGGDGYRIKELQTQETLDKARIELLEKKYEPIAEIEKGILDRLERLEENLNQTMNRLSHHNERLPYLIWLHSYMNDIIIEGGHRLQSIIENYRYGQAATYQLGQMYNISSLSKVLPEDTLIEEITRESANTVVIKVAIRNVSKDTKVYEVIPFKYIDNITTEPTLMVYEGANYLIYNKTSRCVKTISEPKENLIQENCIDYDFKDPKLKHWVKQNITADYKIRPQRKRAGLYNYVYCYGYNITLLNETHVCPPYPFRLPISTGFETHGVIHMASSIQIISEGWKWEKHDTDIPRALLPDQTFTDVSLIDTIARMKADHKRLGEANVIITIETFYASIILILIASLLLLVYFVIRHKQRTTGGSEETEYRWVEVQPQPGPSKSKIQRSRYVQTKPKVKKTLITKAISLNKLSDSDNIERKSLSNSMLSEV